MRVAIIHYWPIGWRGGEKALNATADLLPDADICTHVADPDSGLRNERGRPGIARAKFYSWDATGRRVGDALSSCA
jgi:hypothetical protein